eukprot:12831631-Prorocentrum_lima.AAC.1
MAVTSPLHFGGHGVCVHRSTRAACQADRHAPKGTACGHQRNAHASAALRAGGGHGCDASGRRWLHT